MCHMWMVCGKPSADQRESERVLFKVKTERNDWNKTKGDTKANGAPSDARYVNQTNKVVSPFSRYRVSDDSAKFSTGEPAGAPLWIASQTQKSREPKSPRLCAPLRSHAVYSRTPGTYRSPILDANRLPS